MVHEVEIKGKRHPVLFNIGCLSFWADRIDIKMSDVMTKFEEEDISEYEFSHLMYSGIKYGHMSKGSKLKTSFLELQEEFFINTDLSEQMATIFRASMEEIAKKHGDKAEGAPVEGKQLAS